MKQALIAVILLTLSACAWAGLPEEGLGDDWITEGHLEPGLTDQDRILYSFPLEDATGWTVDNGPAAVETSDKFYGEACLRLPGRQGTFIWREAAFTLNPLTFVTCAFRPEVGATAKFALRDAQGRWHHAIANSGYYWTHGYQHVLGRFSGFYFKPQLQVGDEITGVGFAVGGSADVLVDDFHVVEATSGYTLHALLPVPAVAVPIANPIEIPDFEVRHPFIKLTPEQVAQRRAAYQQDPAVAAEIIAEADAAIAEWQDRPYHLPVGDRAVGGCYYTCDVHPEVVLKFDSQRPDYRWCDKCQKNVINERTTNAWIDKYSVWFYQQVAKCGLAYSYTGDDRYAAEVRRRALLFCQTVRDYPSVMFGGGMSNTLWKNITLKSICMNYYDLTYDSSVWTEADRQTLRNYLGTGTGPPQQPGSYTGNYISAGAYQGLLSGLLFGDKQAVYHAVNYSMGRTIQYLFDDDGMWREKTWGYHNMVAHGIYAPANLAQKYLGLDIYHHNFGDRNLKRAYEIWVKGSFPDGSLPLINDNRSYSHGRGGGLNINPWLKTVYQIYGDPIFDPDNRPLLDSMDLRGPGWAYLRSDAEALPDQVVAVLDYGSQRGAGHGHSDTMQLLVWANGETIAPDLDVAEYTRYPFYYAPGGHNTMAPLPAEGRTEFFSDGPALKAISAATYQPSHLQHRRTVLLAADGSFLVDFFSAASDRDEGYAWHWRCPGQFHTALDMAPYDGLNMKQPDYSILEQVRAAPTDEVWQARWQTDNQTAVLRMLGAGGTTVVAAAGYGYLPTERMTMLVVRRQARETLYAGLFEAYREQSRLRQASALQPGAGYLGWHVATASGEYDFIARSEAEATRASWERGATDALLFAAAFTAEGELRQLICLNGSRLRAAGIEVAEGDFAALELGRTAAGVAVNYTGEGPLKLVLPWRLTAVTAGSEGATLHEAEAGTLLALPEMGRYALAEGG